MDLEDLTSRVDNNTDHMQISRWNNHQEEVNLRLHERLSLTRRVPRLELNCEINLQTRSQRAIPQLKQLLSKLTSPVHKPTRKLQSNAKVVVQPRHNLKPHAVVKMVLDSPARVSKDEIKSIK